jgi:hypothetical protein
MLAVGLLFLMSLPAMARAPRHEERAPMVCVAGHDEVVTNSIGDHYTVFVCDDWELTNSQN